MNKYIRYKILALLLLCNQIVGVALSSYIVSKEELVSICASSTIAHFPISIEILQSYPISDFLLESINNLITDFWQEYEQYKDDNTVSKKESAFHLLAKVNRNMKIRIQNIDTPDPQVKSLLWIMWGYALLVIHYQIIHILN